MLISSNQAACREGGDPGDRLRYPIPRG